MINQRTILVIDDEPSIREMLTIFLEEMGYIVDTADCVRAGIAAVDTGAFDLVMCDLRLPDGTGLEVLDHARNDPSAPPFIIITAHTTPQNALDALRAGAAEYLSKPFNVEDLRLILRNILGAEPSNTPVKDSGLIGSSQAIQRVLSLVGKVAATPSTVLISGESGTGKELLARAIHSESQVSSGPFLSINCGAMPENLLESELFGHVRGSFTGAVKDHVGLIAQAENGTILLDEVGEMTPSMQVKLLRVLQERRIRPVGGHREIKVNTRVLAATNRDLAEEVRRGNFREDLFYRLHVIVIHLPPLRDRLEDLPELARFFVQRCCQRFGIPQKRLSEDAVRLLRTHTWPGNVRELENVIERTVALEAGELISSGVLTEHLHGITDATSISRHILPEEGIDLEEYLNGLRADFLRQALDLTDGHQKQAAEMLRLSYRAFRYHAEKLGLSRGSTASDHPQPEEPS